MIESIVVNNYALIEKTEILPVAGFNVITGETGAGKSILLGAIGLTLGQRADNSVLIDKSRKCIVEVVYNVGGYTLESWFGENGLDYDRQVIVRREISPDGKSRAFINDTPVNNKDLKEFGSFIIDIHSQHQSLLLAQPEYQTNILDVFAGNKEIVAVYQEKYLERKRKSSEYKALKELALQAEKEADYINFQLSQLEAANLKAGEKEELEAELALLSNAGNIKSGFHKLTYQLRDADEAVIGTLKNLKNLLSSLTSSVQAARDYTSRLESVSIELQDLSEEAEYKAENVECNPGRMEEINTRLHVIYDLIFKYKTEGVDQLLEMQQEFIKKLNGIQSDTDKIKILEINLKQLEEEMQALAADIYRTREAASGNLCDMMKKLLVELGIKHAEFVVSMQQTEEYTPTGTDEVKFLFSANKNQEPGEISKVASGGEISRVMLALKYMLSKSKQLPVIILDEIDTGLSGEVAYKMALMMQEMAGRMQVIAISHLPQIASAGDVHFKVYKEDAADQTISRIKELNSEERVREIAGMMSGANVSEAAIEAARTLLNR